jgi:hypothetical protein
MITMVIVEWSAFLLCCITAALYSMHAFDCVHCSLAALLLLILLLLICCSRHSFFVLIRRISLLSQWCDLSTGLLRYFVYYGSGSSSWLRNKNIYGIRGSEKKDALMRSMQKKWTLRLCTMNRHRVHQDQRRVFQIFLHSSDAQPRHHHAGRGKCLWIQRNGNRGGATPMAKNKRTRTAEIYTENGQSLVSLTF